jgi:hypothetical protein
VLLYLGGFDETQQERAEPLLTLGAHFTECALLVNERELIAV